MCVNVSNFRFRMSRINNIDKKESLYFVIRTERTGAIILVFNLGKWDLGP